MTADSPAASLMNTPPASIVACVELVNTLVLSDTSAPKAILPTESSQNTAAFFAEPL